MCSFVSLWETKITYNVVGGFLTYSLSHAHPFAHTHSHALTPIQGQGQHTRAREMGAVSVSKRDVRGNLRGEGEKLNRPKSFYFMDLSWCLHQRRK